MEQASGAGVGMITIFGLIVLVLIVGAILFASLAGLTALARWNRTALSVVLGGGGAMLLLLLVPFVLLMLWVTPGRVEYSKGDSIIEFSERPSPVRNGRSVTVAYEERTQAADDAANRTDAPESASKSESVREPPVSPDTERPQPEGTRITTEPRPDWIDEPAALQGDVYRQVVHAGPHPRRIEAEKELEEQIRSAVKDYLNEAIAPDAARRVELPADYIRREIVREQFTEVHQRSFGTLADDVYMVDLYAQLEFSRPVYDEAKERYRQAVVEDRLWLTGFSLAAALGLLGTVFGYLRFDEATGGQRRGRLRFVAAGAILVLLAAGVLAARWSPWM